MAAQERVLTQQELNRAVLARQPLLDRAELPLPRAVDPTFLIDGVVAVAGGPSRGGSHSTRSGS